MGYNEIMKKIDALKFACFVLLLVFAAWAVEHYHLYHRLIMLKGWIRMNGPAGIAVFVVFYGLAFSFGVPAIALTVFAGTVFGAMTGFLASSAGATISIMLTFFLSRFLARDLIKDHGGKTQDIYKNRRTYGKIRLGHSRHSQVSAFYTRRDSELRFRPYKDKVPPLCPVLLAVHAAVDIYLYRGYGCLHQL